MRRVLLLQLVDFGLKLQLVAFLCRYVLRLIQIHRLLDSSDIIPLQYMLREKMHGERLVQVIAPRLVRHRALPPVLLLIDLLQLLLLLRLLRTRLQVGATVHASSHHLRVVRDSLVGPHVFFVDEVVSGRDRVVPIRLDTLHRVLVVEAVLLLHHFEDRLVEGHLFFAWEKAADSLFFGKLEPRVASDVLDRVAGVWVRI